jgi:hypothetical protein
VVALRRGLRPTGGGEPQLPEKRSVKGLVPAKKGAGGYSPRWSSRSEECYSEDNVVLRTRLAAPPHTALQDVPLVTGIEAGGWSQAPHRTDQPPKCPASANPAPAQDTKLAVTIGQLP